MAAWRPPGRANTIAATYAHIVRNQDEDLNRSFLRRPMLLEGAWRGKAGLPDCDDFAPEATFDWPALHAYGRAVGAYVIEAVDALTEDDLNVVASISTPDIAVWHGLDVVRLTVGHHIRLHGGEIACLKGLQGAKGYLSGQDTYRP
jgi:hypothetical protein